MIVEWTNDYDLINSTITHPAVYPFVSDDTCKSADQFVTPDFSSEFFCAACYLNELYVGCFCFFHKSDDEVEIHTCLLPAAKGYAKEFGLRVVELIFNNTRYTEISTFIPENNPLAKRLALKCGFLYGSEVEPLLVDGQKIKTHKYILNRSSYASRYRSRCCYHITGN